MNQQTQRGAQPQKIKSVDDYLKDLDALLKRNTGQGLYVGQDVSSNTPMYIPGRVNNPTGLNDTASNYSLENKLPQSTLPETIEEPIVEETPQEEQPITIGEFFDQFQQQYDNPQPQGVSSTPDGGTLATDGVIYYPDGTQRVGDPNATSTMSSKDGGTLYSDGSVKKTQEFGMSSYGVDAEGRPIYKTPDGRFVYGSMGTGETGTSGLIKGLFGQDRPITQEYGVINPIEPTPGHVNVGTDVRTRDLVGSERELKFPVDTKVVQVYTDDGNPYGNSLLLQLPSGEMIRVSHMSQMAQLQPGDTVPANQVFGIPGDTGNTTGEHADLEYYNQDGQRGDPREFQGYGVDEKAGDVVSGYESPQMAKERQFQEKNQPQPVLQPVQKVSASQGLAQTINTINPTGSKGVGLTEYMQNNPEAARQEQIKTLEETPAIGKTLSALTGLPTDTGATELAKEQGTNVFRQFAGNVADIASTPFKKIGVPDTGFSEWLAGGKTVNTDENLAPQAGAYDGVSRPKQPKDYAEVLGQNLRDIGDYASDELAQAGQGVANVAQKGLDALGNVFKPKQPVVKRAIGDVSGVSSDPSMASSVMDTESFKLPKNDIRDPFFKNGGASQFANYLSGKDTGGALTLDLFKPEFYENADNIKSVFGTTPHLMGGAMGKNQAFEEKKRAEQEARDMADRQQKPGELTEEWMKRTGQQSTIDQIRKSGGVVGQSEPQSTQSSQPTYFSSNGALNQSARDLIKTIPNGVGPKNPNPAGLPLTKAPVSAPSAQLKVQPSQNSGIFSGLSSLIRKVFGK